MASRKEILDLLALRESIKDRFLLPDDTNDEQDFEELCAVEKQIAAMRYPSGDPDRTTACAIVYAIAYHKYDPAKFSKEFEATLFDRLNVA